MNIENDAMIMLLSDSVDKRCSSMTTDAPRRQLSTARQYSGLRVVNLPSDTYQHHTELQPSSDIHTIFTLNAELLLVTSLLAIIFVHCHF